MYTACASRDLDRIYWYVPSDLQQSCLSYFAYSVVIMYNNAVCTPSEMRDKDPLAILLHASSND